MPKYYAPNDSTLRRLMNNFYAVLTSTSTFAPTSITLPGCVGSSINIVPHLHIGDNKLARSSLASYSPHPQTEWNQVHVDHTLNVLRKIALRYNDSIVGLEVTSLELWRLHLEKVRQQNHGRW